MKELMKTRKEYKLMKRLFEGKSAMVDANFIQKLRMKGIEYTIICSTFSHNSCLMGGKKLIGTNGKTIKSKGILTEIKLI